LKHSPKQHSVLSVQASPSLRHTPHTPLTQLVIPPSRRQHGESSVQGLPSGRHWHTPSVQPPKQHSASAVHGEPSVSHGGGITSRHVEMTGSHSNPGQQALSSWE